MKKALFVIDFINGIAEGKGTCANFLNEHPDVIANTNKLISTSHRYKVPIFHIRLAFDPNYSNLPKYAPFGKVIRDNQLFQVDSPETEFISSIKVYPDDVIINKNYGDVFHGNSLLNELKKNDIKTIFFTGISTDNAILNSCNTAVLNDFYVIVVKDACGAPTKEAHINALNIMKGRTASDIITSEEANTKLAQL